MTFTVGDLFRSHGGTGDDYAVLDGISGQHAVMQFIRLRGVVPRRGREFRVPLWYLSHKSSGWVRVQAQVGCAPVTNERSESSATLPSEAQGSSSQSGMNSDLP